MSAKKPTANQRAARATVANGKLRCPNCGRGAALSARYELVDGIGRRVGSARECRYCGHEVGVRHGESFGRPARDLAARRTDAHPPETANDGSADA